MEGEYKPGFRAWLFSVIIAAGFGSLIADGLRYFVVELSKSDATLKVRDFHFRRNETRGQWTFYVTNDGDKVALITDVEVNGENHNTFYTNRPIKIYESDSSNFMQRAHVAVVEPDDIVAIAVNVNPSMEERPNICLKSGIEIINCIED